MMISYHGKIHILQKYVSLLSQFWNLEVLLHFIFNWALSEYSTNILKDFMHKKPVLHQLLTFNYSNHIGFKDGMKYI